MNRRRPPAAGGASSAVLEVSYFFPVASVSGRGGWRRWAGGLLLAGAGVLACADPVAAQEGAPLVVRQLAFEGNRALTDLTLASSIGTTASSWFARSGLVRWIGLGQKRTLSEVEFERDVLRLQVLYRRSGFLEARVDTLVRRTARDVYITFRITEGRPVVVTELRVRGLDSLPEEDRRRVVQDLPLRVGQPFNRATLQLTIDSLAQRLRNRGFPAVDIFREFSADSATYSATVGLDVETGPFTRVSGVRVEGTRRVDTSVVRSLLVTRRGRAYGDDELVVSQLNLYRSDLFDLASVSVDSAAWDPAAGAVPLVARVAEAKRHRTRASVGYGTNDCFRLSAGYTRRNFLGSGRLLDVSGRVSKLGVGAPTSLGLDRSICSALEDDPIGSAQLNYNLTASVRRPAFLSPQNNLSVSVFSERRSEFAVFLREDVGLSTSLVRESRVRRDPISLTYTFSYGRTEATAAVFCSYFSVCTEQVRALQQERRPLATLTLAASRPRTNNPVAPTRGHILSAEATWSSTLLGSSSFSEFTRFSAEGRAYRTLAPGVVLSGRLRGGVVLSQPFSEGQAPNFVPLEQRFYAGGPNDVRGFTRNLLGPVVYVVSREDFDTPGRLEGNVTAFATGGDALTLGNVELTFPAPVLPERLQLAAFVDVGAVWQRETEANLRLVRATPGVGVRFGTPLGPLRFDLAYNPYRLQPGQLFIEEPTGELTPAAGFEAFQPRGIGGFQAQISVGRAF